MARIRKSKQELQTEVDRLKGVVDELTRQRREIISNSSQHEAELGRDVELLRNELISRGNEALTTMAIHASRHHQVLQLLQMVVNHDLTLQNLHSLLTAIAMENTGVLLMAAQRVGIQTEPTGLEKRVLDELDAGRKIQAIKLYRDETGEGLKDAKEFVEALQARYRSSN